MSTPQKEVLEYTIKGKVVNNRIEQVAIPRALTSRGSQTSVAQMTLLGGSETAVRDAPPIKAETISLVNAVRKVKAVRTSWGSSFLFQEEKIEEGQIVQAGLRAPQLGALYAALGYWKTGKSTATIVMPTGTGKTETMLALLAKEQLECVLVVVPTNALRSQIANKFLTFGLLRTLGVLKAAAQNPIVGILEHKFTSPEEVKDFFPRCNVVVTTMAVLTQCDDAIQREIAEQCSYLFIDEAHHIAAQTWNQFRTTFGKENIVQFTATPFRNDGRHVDGKVIYNYPLGKAQQEGYFKKINFEPVTEYDPLASDKVIAQKAITQLDSDLNNSLDHLVMARVSKIERAKEVHKLYEELAPGHKPILIHSRQTKREQTAAMESLKNRTSRIVVCVDMLGEGFDLRQLKISALHDAHKSLAITLQFIGRFTRSGEDIGDATFVANIADPGVEEALQDLYSKDADWNKILPGLSSGATRKHAQKAEFLEAFSAMPEEIPLQNIFPKMSTVVYKSSKENWTPSEAVNVVKNLYGEPAINTKDKVMLFVTREQEGIRWGDIKNISNVEWNLFVLHWDDDKKLLYVNSSSNQGVHLELAQAVAGEDVQIIKGEQVFRALHDITYMILFNLGLRHSLNKAVSYTMHTGASIKDGLSESQTQNRSKVNIFGRGYTGGNKTSIGCSTKGRIWSHKIAYDISDWMEWCRMLGRKLLDESITTNKIIENAIIPEIVSERPNLVPLSIEWPEDIAFDESYLRLEISGETLPIYDAGIELLKHEKEGPLEFKVFTEDHSSSYRLIFENGGVEFIPLDSRNVVKIIGSRKTRTLAEFFQEDTPTIRFENNAFLVGNNLYKLPAEGVPPFSREKLNSWEWAGIDIRKESQGESKETDTVQSKVIQTLLADESYEVVFDDDGPNEVADVVAIKRVESTVVIDLYHCKYSGDNTPGARVSDLYAVCGQAQKSIHWKSEPEQLIEHLRRREALKISKTGRSRLEKGTPEKLVEIRRTLPFAAVEVNIHIVQPGVSKAAASNAQLHLLAATELFLKESFAADLEVITSP